MKTRKPRRRSRRGFKKTPLRVQNKELAYIKAGGRCHWCRKPLTRDEATLEHIRPLAAGGDNHLDNLSIACEPCQQLNVPEVWND